VQAEKKNRSLEKVLGHTCIFLDRSGKSSVLHKNIRKWAENELRHRTALNVFQRFQFCDGI